MTRSSCAFAILISAFALAVSGNGGWSVEADSKADPGAQPGQSLAIYFLDMGQGPANATLLVAPSGETMLLDAGPEYAARQLLDVLKQAGVKRVDHLVITHFHADHWGGTTTLAEALPIRNYVDHGPSVEQGKSDDWWQQRRGPWFRPGMGKEYDRRYEAYLKVRESSRHTVVKAGDVIPIQGMEVRVLCAGGKVLDQALPGAGAKNPVCADVDRRGDDDAEDAQSIGVLVRLGKFRFVFLGDLTWNVENALFCPTNKVGTADAYLITHHAQSFPREMGDYYHGLSACPKSEVHGLRPRVAILSLGSRGHVQGTSEAIQNVRGAPGLEDVWQTNLVLSGGEKDHNSANDFIANIGARKEPVRFLKLTAKADGTFTMLNSRNNFTKTYPPRRE